MPLTENETPIEPPSTSIDQAPLASSVAEPTASPPAMATTAAPSAASPSTVVSPLNPKNVCGGVCARATALINSAASIAPTTAINRGLLIRRSILFPVLSTPAISPEASQTARRLTSPQCTGCDLRRSLTPLIADPRSSLVLSRPPSVTRYHAASPATPSSAYAYTTRRFRERRLDSARRASTEVGDGPVYRRATWVAAVRDNPPA